MSKRPSVLSVASSSRSGSGSGSSSSSVDKPGDDVQSPQSPQVTRLANGLRIVSHDMAHLETVSLGIYVSCGARHERRQDNGISHFLEHMAFKGTARRSAREIAEEIEQVGGDLNAATSLETTAYYARVLKADLGLAMDILADILRNPSYDEDEIERERDVILQEIAAAIDSPDDLAYDIIQDVAFPEQAIGRQILGTKESVSSFTVKDLRRFLDDNYTPERMVISAAGAVDHDELVRLAQSLFAGAKTGVPSVLEPAIYKGGTRALDKTFEQSHMVMAFKSPSYLSEKFYACHVFSGLFGGGMSSRLFQEVREQRGLCYSIYSSCWGLRDTGLFTIHAATGNETLMELIEVVSAQLNKAATEPPKPREVDRAKAQMKAGLLMSLESSSARAEQMARHIIAYDRVQTTAELIAKVEAVTPRIVCDTAQELLLGAKSSLAVVGKDANQQIGQG